MQIFELFENKKFYFMVLPGSLFEVDEEVAVAADDLPREAGCRGVPWSPLLVT